MNGAESLIRSFVAAGVDVCFANPGTSEMHLVQAIDAVPEMRAVLALFEGVCTGAADGYGRMRGTPALTLLHLGPGLANGIANLHNARRARTPLINVVGNHALYHVELDAPLTSDIDTLARNVSSWIKSDSTAATLAGDGMAALQASMTARDGSAGQIASLIVPVDACWSDADGVAAALALPRARAVPADRIEAVAASFDADSLLLLDGAGLTPGAQVDAARAAHAAGARVMYSTFPARTDGGPGTPRIDKLPYFPEHVLATLAGVKRVVLAGAATPVSFFAYPDMPGVLLPEGCEAVTLASGDEDVGQALAGLAAALDAPADGFAVYEASPADPGSGALSTGAAAACIARRLPEGAILCGDSGGGGAAFAPTQRAAANTWLNLTGGSIGQGGPAAVGAAVACPDRQVFALLGDGASMYTIQALWTQAREALNVITVVFSNRTYGILETEYRRLGVNEVGDRAAALFDLSRPDIDFSSLAVGMGVNAHRASRVEEFDRALETALAVGGPHLIEAIV